MAEHLARRLVEKLDQGTCDALRTNPLASIPPAFGIEVRLRAESSSAGTCSVDGSYFDQPPRISVALSASHGRRYFTALHELGHYLQRNDLEIMDALVADDDPWDLEEEVCDVFAAEVLLPPELVGGIIGDAGPTAQEVARLFRQSQASREACCVRAAQRIRGSGYVMLGTPEGLALFTANHNVPYRVARRTPQGADHLVARAGRMGSARGESRICYASGTLSPPYHADAVRDADYIFAVFVSDRPPWGGLSILSSDPGPVGYETTCARCGDDFEGFGLPCSRCGDWVCPHCNRCSCNDGLYERVCQRCNLRKHVAQFEARSEICRDCL
ncbi:MAG: ImmA/IrrE family metallo-endopeptidase [Actinomycetota bacterium]